METGPCSEARAFVVASRSSLRYIDSNSVNPFHSGDLVAIVQCNKCGVKLPEVDALTSSIGWLCERCQRERPPSADVEQSCRKYSLYSCACTMASFFINPIGALTIAAVIFGTRALTYANRLSEQEQGGLEDMSQVKWVAGTSIIVALGVLVTKALINMGGF